MKVAHVCPVYFPHMGGVETQVKEISERLVERGFEVDILTTNPSEEFQREEAINGVTVKRFKSWAPSEAYYFSRDLKRYLTENSDNYGIVHSHSYHALPSLYCAQAKGKNKLVFTPHYHGTGHTFFRKLLHIPYKFWGKKIFEKADRIVCVSDYERNLIVKHFRVEEKKCATISNGVNPEEFKGLEKRNKNYRTILYVGRLEKYKGVQYLIRVLPTLDKDTVLEIVGQGSYKRNLVKLVKKLDLEDKVRFYQDLPRNALLQKYNDADIFVLLSEREAFGITVAEALASKTPCILANTSALREWIDNENCFGLDYPPEIDALARLINRVVGKEVHQAKFWDWEEIARRVTQLYEGLSSEP